MKFLIPSLENCDLKESEFSWEIGEEYYSENWVSSKYQEFFRNNSIEFKLIDNPHFINERNKESYKVTKEDIYISFARPFEHIKLCKPSKNIAILNWKFNSLPDGYFTEFLSGSPGFPKNKFRQPILEKFDQIWVSNSNLKKTFEKVFNIPVQVVPCPITYGLSSEKFDKKKLIIPSFSCYRMTYSLHFVGRNLTKDINPINYQDLYKQVKNKKGKIYGTVLNPLDPCKDFISMVRGFSLAKTIIKDSILIVRFSTKGNLDNNQKVEDQIRIGTIYNKLLLKVLNSHASNFKNIYFIIDNLYEDDLNNFLNTLDFYICTSRCEDQNFALQSAMYLGIVPISVNHSSMSDYIKKENSFIIKSKQELIDYTNNTNPSLWGSKWFSSDIFDISDAIIKAFNAKENKLANMRENISKTMDKLYSDNAVLNKIYSVLKIKK